MARDFRAVVHSKMQRGESLDAAAAGWNRAMLQIEKLISDLPVQAFMRLTYEDLCRDPERELRRVCEFLGVAFSNRMLERPTADVHHIGGSPSKFDSGRIEIRFDASHEGAFSEDELRRMRPIVAESARRWGY
jgi:hypothetical protein